MKKLPLYASVAAVSWALLTTPALAQTPAGSGMPADPALVGSVQPSVDDHAIAGAVLLVADQSHVLSVQTLGYADIAAKRPMAANDLFWAASNTKQVTAAALMMLVDAGKVGLDDPIEKYLPEYKGQMIAVESDAQHKLLRAPTHPVTIREAMSHTSGLIRDNPFASPLNVFTLPQRTTVVALEPLNFEPGTKFEYGNGNYETIGRIIEVVSGMPYDKFLQTRLFTPLGMKDTTFWPTDAQLTRLAKSYMRSDDGKKLTEIQVPLTYPLDKLAGTPHPAGGLFSTAQDFLKFARMMMAGGVYNGKRCLSEASVRALTSTQSGTTIDAAGDYGYGLGWFTQHKDTGQVLPQGIHSVGWFNHSGAFGTYISVDPQHQLISILMMQQLNWLPGSISRDTLIEQFKDAALKEYGRG